MKLDELKVSVFEWSRARGIHDQSDYGSQIEKFTEELDEFKDAIGDMCVCLINARYFADAHSITAIDFQLEKLQRVAALAGVNFEECLQMAWDEIKNRVGLMVDGKFVKWENLEHGQRLEVARRGQLEREGVDMVELSKVCSITQWDEILLARNL